VARVPEFADLWNDLMNNVTKLTGNLTGGGKKMTF
jgi:hypothetical protein